MLSSTSMIDGNAARVSSEHSEQAGLTVLTHLLLNRADSSPMISVVDPLKTIFVISPIAKLNHEGVDFTRIFLDDIVKPAAALAGGFAPPVRGDEVKAPGSVTAKVVADILRADVCVADLTQLNPNVMYEVAIAHAAGKPCILMKQEEPDGSFLPPPFDFTTERTIRYGLRADKANSARNDLVEYLRNAGHENEDEFLVRTLNPVRIAFQQHSARVNAEPMDQALLGQLELLTDAVARLSDRATLQSDRDVPLVDRKPALTHSILRGIYELAENVEIEFERNPDAYIPELNSLSVLAEMYGLDSLEAAIGSLHASNYFEVDPNDGYHLAADIKHKNAAHAAALVEFVKAREALLAHDPDRRSAGRPRLSHPLPRQGSA